jgi:hypothetical protein
LVIGLNIPTLPFLIRVGAKAFILLLLPLSFIPIGLVTPTEWQQVRQLLQRQWNLRVLPLVRRKPTE